MILIKHNQFFHTFTLLIVHFKDFFFFRYNFVIQLDKIKREATHSDPLNTFKTPKKYMFIMFFVSKNTKDRVLLFDWFLGRGGELTVRDLKWHYTQTWDRPRRWNSFHCLKYKEKLKTPRCKPRQYTIPPYTFWESDSLLTKTQPLTSLLTILLALLNFIFGRYILALRQAVIHQVHTKASWTRDVTLLIYICYAFL